MPVAAGKLRHRGFIEQATRSQSTSGETTLGPWTPIVSRPDGAWANIVPLQGRELENARQVSPQVTHRIELRYTRDVTADMRFNWQHKNRRFNILAVTHIGELNEETHLLCEEVQGREDIEE